MPTLIEKGTIEIPKRVTPTERNRINDMVAKDYVVERIGRKVNPSRYELNPNIKDWSDHFFIIEAGTGSGKSVSIPPEMYLNFHGAVGRNMVTTQPRQISAIKTVQDDIIKWYPLKLGIDVGYQTGAVAKKPIQGLIFVTIGLLLQQMKIMDEEQFMMKYSIIILDEAHERSLDMDLVMSFLKDLVQKYWDDPQCPTVILMSATLEMDRFSKYFGNPEVIRVAGKTFDVQPHFLDMPAGNYIWKIIDTVKEIHNADNGDNSDILIFVSGAKDTKKLMQELTLINEQLETKFYPMEFSRKGVIDYKGQILADIEVPIELLNVDGQQPTKKVIVSTNIAETSLTVKTLKYVIDSGFRRAAEFDPAGYTSSLVKPVTQDMAKQRRGRVGRVAVGEWYPIYTEESFNQFQEAKFPDIFTANIAPAILSLIIREESINKLSLMDVPPSDSLEYAIEKLYMLGAITWNGKIEATELGNLINKFRKVSLENIRMILAGYQHGANILHLITIAAMVGSEALVGFKYKPQHDDRMLDLLFLFDIFKDKLGKSIKKTIEWCRDSDISYQGMLLAVDMRDSIIEDMILVVGLDPLHNANNDLSNDELMKIKMCIYDGYKQNIAIREDDKFKTHNIALHIKTDANVIVYTGLSFMATPMGYQMIISGYYSIMDDLPIDLTLL